MARRRWCFFQSTAQTLCHLRHFTRILAQGSQSRVRDGRHHSVLHLHGRRLRSAREKPKAQRGARKDGRGHVGRPYVALCRHDSGGLVYSAHAVPTVASSEHGGLRERGVSEVRERQREHVRCKGRCELYLDMWP